MLEDRTKPIQHKLRELNLDLNCYIRKARQSMQLEPKPVHCLLKQKYRFLQRIIYRTQSLHNITFTMSGTIQNYPPYKEPGNCGQFSREKTMNANPKVAHALELSNKDFKGAIKTMFIRSRKTHLE